MAPRLLVCTLAVISISLLATEGQGFALKRKNVETKLNEALKVIERKKRHVDFEDEEDQDWVPQNADLYNWDEEYPNPLRAQYQNIFDFPALKELYAERYLDEQGSPRNGYDWSSLLGEEAEEEEDENIPEVGESDEAEVPVSGNELEDIFDFDNEVNEDEKPDKREYDPSQKDDNKRHQDIGLTKDQVQQLVGGADDALAEALSGNGDDKSASLPVTEAEINDIFKDIENTDGDSPSRDGDGVSVDGSNEDNLDNILENDNISEDAPEDINKEWLSQYIMNGAPTDAATSTKKKRSSWHTYPSPSSYGLSSGAIIDNDRLDELTNELAVAKADIKIMKDFLALEDEENANLAKALNYATKSQTERTDKYVKDEIQYIRDAINDEVDLQEIKDVLQIANSLRDESNDDELEEGSQLDDEEFTDTSAEKRGFPDVDEEDIDPSNFPLASLSGSEEEEEIVEPEEDEEEIDESISQLSGDDLVNIILANKLRRMLSKGGQVDLSSVYDQEVPVQSWLNAPVDEQVDTAGDNDVYINPLMRELYEKLQVQNQEKRGDDFGDVIEEEAPEVNDELDQALMEALTNSVEMCPAVEDLTDNCEFMSDLGMGLDDEAADLCNRHQLCYTCGSALELSPNDCDRGYLSEAALLCEKEGGCDEDAAKLFIVMLKFHRFQPLSRIPDQCADTCAQDYIAGRYNK